MLLDETPGIDHFRRLGLAPRFALDVEDLEARLIAHSRVLHPDRFIGRSEAERAKSLRSSAALNDAVVTLRDPWKRADYLLVLLGGPTGAAERRTPPAFVSEMLEAREAVEEAKASGDRAKLGELRASFAARQASLLATIAGQFARLESTPREDRAAFDALAREIRTTLNATTYLATLLRESTES
ncbi:MAG: Fe-S protein assembly co-chaperone HscB [Planctomycetes bacterium]|nr:Fe-S protein assembly co-chaperone HscB [Planctomycetota bacterium]MBI3846267.1 Fe-S protein assembly co-chaperone HscB [Planctomycetota bacterium]